MHKKLVQRFQPDGVEIEQQPVPTAARWVLYLIFVTLLLAVVAAILLRVDRIVVASGQLITTTGQILVQPLERASIRSIDVQVGDLVEKDQVLTTLDSTFSAADMEQLQTQQLHLRVQIRRIRAELDQASFSSLPEEATEGELQKQVFEQRRLVQLKYKQMTADKQAVLDARLDMLQAQRQGQKQQLQVLDQVLALVQRQALADKEMRLRLLQAQKERLQVHSALQSLAAEAEVVQKELHEVESQWQRFVEERRCTLIEQEVELRSELEKVTEALRKASRRHELICMRAPERGIVLDIAERSVGSVLQQAEPFITLVPCGAELEAEVQIRSQDIGRVRSGDQVRLKLEPFPFQRHGTLAGKVRVISENVLGGSGRAVLEENKSEPVYKSRVKLLTTQLQNVPEGTRLLPGMKLRAEIKIGTRSVISYFLYPVIRILDESLREP